MNTILDRLGELLGLKQPKEASMEKMTDMEPMPEPGPMTEMKHMTDMEPMPEPGQMADMEHMPEPGHMMEMEPMQEPGQMADMGQMTHMEQQEHQSNDMPAMHGEMKTTPVQPDRRRERK